MKNMNTSNIQRYHLIYSILLGICIIIAGICLIAACVGIYNSGDHPYSREAVANAFSRISIPVYLCLILTIIGFVTDIIISPTKPKIKPIKAYDLILRNMYEKRNMDTCDSSLKEDIKALRHKRRMLFTACMVITAICSTIFLVYALNKDNFHQTDINGSMLKAMYILIPCIIVSFGFAIFTFYYSEKSITAELELLKKVPAKNTVNIDTVKSETLKINNQASSADKKLDSKSNISFDRVTITRYAILIAGAVLLIYGFVTGGTADVLTKAVNICTECIGLG